VPGRHRMYRAKTSGTDGSLDDRDMKAHIIVGKSHKNFKKPKFLKFDRISMLPNIRRDI